MYPARHVDVLCRVHGVRHRRMFGWSEYYRHLYTVRRSGVLTVVQAPSRKRLACVDKRLACVDQAVVVGARRHVHPAGDVT
jgi:hypothetical protein